ncbi:hypothetical protein A3Q56_06708 [Intoshia linei]|uniref:Uncharacterized protein n=1 Tax=Intoshia linei TaxID=1819745 RepID=A0A177AW14_9BILA|nr:hypothetical protein A3Q56_06708 [Intoshia linei]
MDMLYENDNVTIAMDIFMRHGIREPAKIFIDPISKFMDIIHLFNKTGPLTDYDPRKIFKNPEHLNQIGKDNLKSIFNSIFSAHPLFFHKLKEKCREFQYECPFISLSSSSTQRTLDTTKEFIKYLKNTGFNMDIVYIYVENAILRTAKTIIEFQKSSYYIRLDEIMSEYVYQYLPVIKHLRRTIGIPAIYITTVNKISKSDKIIFLKFIFTNVRLKFYK